LRPGGIFLDIHPELAHERVQVRTGETIQDAGELDMSAYVRDILAGRRQIEDLLREGLFVRDRELAFEHTAHASDVDSWLTYRAEAGSRAILRPEVIERTRALLAPEGGEILIVGPGRATRLRKP
jgi:hypothetical protein